MAREEIVGTGGDSMSTMRTDIERLPAEHLNGIQLGSWV